MIRDAQDLQRHIDYIHFNPVKHGHAVKAIDWPWSSIHRAVRRGDMPSDWAADVEIDDAGEMEGD